MYIVAADDYSGFLYIGVHEDLEEAKKDFEDRKKQRVFEVLYLTKVLSCSITSLSHCSADGSLFKEGK